MSDLTSRFKADKVVYVYSLESGEAGTVYSWGSRRRKPGVVTIRTISSHVIEEIRSGAIIPIEGSPGIYEIEATTSSGRRKFCNAREVTAGDAQSDVVPVTWDAQLREKLVESLRLYLEAKKTFSYSSTSRHSSTLPPSSSHSAELEGPDEPDLIPEVLLGELENPRLSSSERGKLVIEAELLEFSEDQVPSLTKLLRRFIDDYRESNVRSDLIAVASAIRKFVATTDTDEAFEYAASLLRASSRAPLSIELELEVTKMAVRKLAANPPASDQSFPDLAERLKALCETYLNPRLLARDNHGAIALNAVLGLVLTRDRGASDVIGWVHSLGVPWFQQLVGRRAARLKTEVERRCFGDRYKGLLSLLDALSKIVLQKTPT